VEVIGQYTLRALSFIFQPAGQLEKPQQVAFAVQHVVASVPGVKVVAAFAASQ